MKKLSSGQDVDRCVNEKQDSDSVEMQTKASRHSSVVVSGDSSLDAALTPTPNNSVGYAAAGNLAFLLSVIRCGESLSVDEEAHVREVIERLGAISPFPLESDVQKKIVEIRERQARRGHWKRPRPNPRYPDPEPDIATLLSIIDTLQRAIPLAAFESHKIDGRIAESISQCAASNMKAELIKRVQERAAEIEAAYDARDGISTIPVGAAAQLTRLAIELETVELTQDTKSALRGHNPNRGTSVRNHTESESVPDVQAAPWTDEQKVALSLVYDAIVKDVVTPQDKLMLLSVLATSPVQPEVSKEQDNAEG